MIREQPLIAERFPCSPVRAIADVLHRGWKWRGSPAHFSTTPAARITRFSRLWFLDARSGHQPARIWAAIFGPAGTTSHRGGLRLGCRREGEKIRTKPSGSHASAREGWYSAPMDRNLFRYIWTHSKRDQ